MNVNKKLYGSLVVLAIVFALIIKLFIRPEFIGASKLSDLFLGSLPSFFYIFGFCLFVPLLKSDIEFQKYLKTCFAITIGALIYELGQLWSERIFDVADIIFTILGAVSSIFIFYLTNVAKNNAPT